MKKIILLLALIISITATMKVNAKEVPDLKNISIEKKDDNYLIKFKNQIKDKNLKVEVDVKNNKTSWSSERGILISKDISDNGFLLNRDEILSIAGKDLSYEFRFRFTKGNKKGEFSEILLIGQKPIFSGESSWAIEELIKAQNKKLIPEGVSKELNKEITREEFAELIVNFCEKANIVSAHESDHIFKDTRSIYANKAYSLKIMGGISDTMFAPKEFLTKEDMAVCIMRAINGKKLDLVKNEEIKDLNLLRETSKDQVKKFISFGIVNLENGKFNPKKKVTKQEAIIVLLRTMEKLK